MGEQKVMNGMKRFEELQFCDDFLFGKIMADRELCRKVLECLLQHSVGELTEVQTQREIRYTSDGKPIRLDVYNKDRDGRIYDAEMQNLNNKTVESHHLPKRSRFYQGAIDIDIMNRGNSYKKLPESSVMFICTFDPFGLGMSQYTFHERCDEAPKLYLDDGTVKVFYNCTYKGEDIPDDIRNLYDYIGTGFIGDELTERLNTAVTKARRNEVWRAEYMKEWVIIQDAKEEGYEEAQNDAIKRMLRSGKTAEAISDFCGYPLDQVKEVEKELMVAVQSSAIPFS